MILGLLLAAAGATPTALRAAGPSETAKRAEATMVVTGTVTLTPDGGVRSYSIYRRDDLPAPVAELIDKNAPNWRFEPVRVDGKPVAATADMSLRILARPIGDGRYALSIHGGHFGNRDPTEGVRRVKVERPVYPQVALRDRVGGTVYLLLELDARGHVTDVAAEQVNLDQAGSDPAMERWRRALQKSALNVARDWAFSLPARFASARRDPILVRVPVHYAIRPAGTPDHQAYGSWDVYIPGPREIVPWADRKLMVADGNDALPDDGVFPVGSGLHLTTPLGGA